MNHLLNRPRRRLLATRRLMDEFDAIADESPTTSLARLIAEKQAEVMKRAADRLRSDAKNAMHGYGLHLAADVVDEMAVQLRRQAEEPTE